MTATGIYVEMVEMLTKATEAYRGAHGSMFFGRRPMLRKATNALLLPCVIEVQGTFFNFLLSIHSYGIRMR